MTLLQSGLAKSLVSDYTIDQSLRVDLGGAGYLTRTSGSDGDRKTWTFSWWMKMSDMASYRDVFGCVIGAGYNRVGLEGGSGQIIYEDYNGTVFQSRCRTQQYSRDPASWYHFLLRWDSTESAAADRLQWWINGERVTVFQVDTQASLNDESNFINTTATMYIASSTTTRFGGYLAEFYFIDGTAYTASDFGETDEDTNQWIPKDASGLTFGTNGYYLKFQDSSALGDDSSGNTNDFAVTNLAATDQVKDSPTNNFCTINPLANFYAGATLTEGNLKQSGPSANTTFTISTFASASGKWYCEFYVTTGTTTSAIGISSPPSGSSTYLLGDSGYAYGYLATGEKRHDSSTTSYGSTWTTGDVMAIALDLDNNKLYFAKNNTWQDSGVPTSGATGTGAISILAASAVSFFNSYFMCAGHNTAGADSVFVANFGQDSSFVGAKTAGGNVDSNGVGDFFYTPPTDFLALASNNLPVPSIIKSGTAFNTVIYTGTGIARSITGVGFAPDLVWFKNRGTAGQFNIVNDTIRGANKQLSSNSTEAETSDVGVLTAFDSDGFSVGTASSGNEDTKGIVSWNWLAGGSAVTNDDGSLQTKVSVNTTAGFSIVLMNEDGTSSTQTLGHGLAQAPELVIGKPYNVADHWRVGSNDLTSWAYFLYLALANAQTDHGSTGAFAATAPTASVVTVGEDGLNNTGRRSVLYCFYSVEGYSKFGRYEGNGESAANAPFIYCGFRPAWIMIKGIDAASRNWIVYDNKRSPYNEVDVYLEANDSAAEDTGGGEPLDFLSNGFKIRSDQAQINPNETCIFLAFAEAPFKYANAR